MKNNISELIGSLPNLFRNTHLSVNIQGWPATVAIIAVSLAGITALAIKVLDTDA